MSKLPYAQSLGAIALCTAFLIGGPSSGYAQDLEDEQNQLYEAAKLEGDITVYTSLGSSDMDAMISGFNEKYPEINTRYYRAGSGSVLEKLLSEHEAGVHNADVLIFHSTNAWNDLKSQGILMEYNSPVYAEFPDYAQDRSYTVSGRTITNMIGYNSTLVDDDLANSLETFEDWVSLAERTEYSGRFGMQDVTTGAGLENIYTLYEYHGEPQGKEWLGRLFAAGLRMSPGGDAQIQNLSSGQEAFNFFVPTHRLRAAIDSGAPVKFRPFVDGQYFFLSPMSIYARSRNPNAAKLFFNWWNSAEGQTLMSRTSGVYSTRTDVPAPEGFPDKAELNLIELGMEHWPRMQESTEQIIRSVSEVR